MQIETYEIEEATTEGREPAEVEAVAVQMIEEMGLEGQKRLLKPQKHEDGDTFTRIPYPRMKAEEEKVYSVLFESQVDVGEHDAGIIPLRVLQVVAHARSLFEEVEVWYPEVHDPDPVLVGKRRPPGRTYGWEFFLLARWGDVLVPFEELRERAIIKLRKDWKRKLEEATAKARQFEANLETNLLSYFAGSYISTPW